MTSPSAQITLRPALADDAAAVRRLAALDSAAVPAPPLLLAEADGALRAALSIATGAAIADPFYRSAQITLRPALADDAAAVRRLAALDSAAVPAPPLLLAEADGVLRAALSIATGAAIADPFYRSAGLVTLLRAHPPTGDETPVRRRALALSAPRRRPRPDLARC